MEHFIQTGRRRSKMLKPVTRGAKRQKRETHKSKTNGVLTRGEREASEGGGGAITCSGWLGSRARRRGAGVWGGSGQILFFFFLFFHFLRYFNLVLDYFLDFKNKVLCCRVGPWVLFYLTRQNDEPSTGDSEYCEAKNWREGWCSSGRPPTGEPKN